MKCLIRSAWMLLVFVPWVQADTLAEAQACARETNRLARLACFDAVFGTPVPDHDVIAEPDAERPERWRQAYAQAGSADQETAIRYRDTGRSAGHLVTVSALGVQPPRPLLTLQCHNNITELALMLPEPLAAERVRLDVAGELSDWRVRDHGVVVSAGRGLPAIRTAKRLLSRSDVRVQASEPALDGLLFDLDGLAAAVQPLRSHCGW